jgi:RND family efflux transporter MFP subunit
MGVAVQAGAPLLTLDATVYRAELRKAEAELRRTEERLASHERLFADGSITRAEYEEARAMAEIARADLAIRRHERDACEITAPYDARVAVVHVHAHEIVEPGRPLVEILDDRVLYAVVLAPSNALPRIRAGAAVPIRVRETGAVVRGAVSQVGARVDPASATAKVRIRVENDGTLRAGMRGLVRLADLASLPASAADSGAPAATGGALPPIDRPPEPHE